MSVSKEERLLNLFCALLDAYNPLSHQSINEKIEGYMHLERDASRRQFERDKKDLKELGINLRMQNVPGSDPVVPGYYIDKKEYYLKDLSLTPEERVALNIFLGLFKAGEESMEEALLKLGGREAEVQTAFNPFGMIWIDYNADLPKIYSAINKKELMVFDYLTEAGEHNTRQLEPIHLYMHDGYWCLKGYDRDRQALRSFRIDRIQGKIKFEATGNFQPIKDVSTELMPWEYGSQDIEPNMAKLLIDADNVDWAVQQIGPKAKKMKQPDGSAIFEFEVTSQLHFYRLVASFGEAVEVLGDAELREGFISYLKELL